MRFQATDIGGLFVIESDPSSDPRGFFARLHSRREFSDAGIALAAEQTSLSHSREKGTVRGLHFQIPPHAEAKLVCCVAGSAFDAVVDLRRNSKTFGLALWFPLDARRPTMIFVPQGCAHGFQTLEDDTTLLYMISTSYDAAAAGGVRWDDPALGIPWPERRAAVLSERDKSLPLLSELGSIF